VHVCRPFLVGVNVRVIFKLAQRHDRRLPLKLVELLRQKGWELNLVIAEHSTGLLADSVIICGQEVLAALSGSLDGYERDTSMWPQE